MAKQYAQNIRKLVACIRVEDFVNAHWKPMAISFKRWNSQNKLYINDYNNSGTVWLSIFCHFMYTIQWFSISIWLLYFIISLDYDFRILVNGILTIPRCFTVINFRVYLFHVFRQDQFVTSMILSCSRMIVYHYCDVILSALASQITGVSIACSTVCSGED